MRPFMLKKIAIILLDSRTTRSQLSRLHHPDIDFILFCPKEGFLLLDEKSRDVFSEIQFIDKNITADELANLVKPYIKKVSNIKDLFLISCREIFMHKNGVVCDLLGISGITLKEAELFTNKLYMKKKLQHSNVRVPIYFDVENNKLHEHSYADFLDTKIKSSCGYPMIGKPISEEGAIGVTKISSKIELTNFLSSLKQDKSYELEEFIVGDLYECDSIVVDNKITYFSASIYSCPINEFSYGRPLGVLELLQENSLFNELKSFNEKVLLILSPPNGATHLEVFRKLDGELVFLEIGARPPGAYSCQINELNSGINLEEASIKAKLGISYDFTIQRDKAYAMFFYFPKKSGKVTKINPPHLHSTYKINWYISVGETLNASTDIASDSQLAAVMFVYNSDYSLLQDDFNTLKSHSILSVE